MDDEFTFNLTATKLDQRDDSWVIVIDDYGTLGPVSYDMVELFLMQFAPEDEAEYSLRITPDISGLLS